MKVKNLTQMHDEKGLTRQGQSNFLIIIQLNSKK